MTNPIDALKNADPGRGAVPPDDHWRTRERIIMDAATQTERARRWQRLVPSTAIGAVFALGCGLIVSSAFSGGGLPTIAFGGGSGNLAAASESGKSMDAMWWGNYTFTLAEGVDIPAGAGDVWRWSQPSRSDVDVLMRRLKLTGDVKKLGKDLGGGWSVAADDPAYPDATQLSVGLNGSWYWWKSDSSLTISAAVDCVKPVDPDGTVNDTKECVYQEPAPAKNLPSDEEARAKAESLLSLGGEYKVTDIWRDKWSVYLTANYVLPDGTLTGVYAGIGFGENGVMTSASGQLGALEKVGSYPTISARDAVARLSSGMISARSGIEVDDVVSPPLAEVAGDGPTSDDSGSGEGSSGSGGATEPAPAPDKPTPEPVDPIVIEEPYEIPEVEVTLTKVKVTYSTMWGADNYIWVLPTYEYTDSNGGIWTAVAIADQYLEGGPSAETTTTVETPTETTIPEEVTTTTIEEPVTESTVPEPPPTTP